jgi:hypothetical protein
MFRYIFINHLKSHIMQAQLRYSTRWFPKSKTMVVWEPESTERLLHRIFGNVMLRNVRFVNNRYFYTPSDEYKSLVVRFKGVRK